MTADRRRPYFRWAAGLLFLYAALLLASWALMAAALGWSAYDAARPTAAALLAIYGNPTMAAAGRLETLAALLLAPALPALALLLARRTPGLAWGGLALGAVAVLLSLVGNLLEGVAYSLGGAAAPAMLAAVPPSDVVLLVHRLAEGITMPAMFIYWPWFILWAVAFARAGTAVGKAAAACFAATLLFALATFAGFAFRLAPLANAGIFLQTVAEAGAFAAAGVTMWRTRE